LYINALEHVRRMRGSSRPHLMRCSDDGYYIVKFQGNPQGTRTLANDLFGSLLARELGLPVPACRVIDVDERLIKLTDGMLLDCELCPCPCLPGLSFGSRYASAQPTAPGTGPPVLEDYLKPQRFLRVTNLADFIGILVFDNWTCNKDTRQFVYERDPERGTWTAKMIDQGWCFNGDSWCFCEPLTTRPFSASIPFDSITGIESFEPWLHCLENEIDITDLEKCAREVPPEWYESDLRALDRLVMTLDRRRHTVRDVLWRTWERSRETFPSWFDRDDNTRRSYSASIY
jgi:hypothetical protein